MGLGRSHEQETLKHVGLLLNRIESDDPGDWIPEFGFGLPKRGARISHSPLSHPIGWQAPVGNGPGHVLHKFGNIT